MASEELRKQIMQQAQDAIMLQLAFIGVTHNLFSTLAGNKTLTARELSRQAGVDEGYAVRWCDGAYAYGLLDSDQDRFSLTELGDAFRPDAENTLMPFAVYSALSAHMAMRVAELAGSGEQPGEKVLMEHAPILPWFGPMLESMFGPMLEQHILPRIDVFTEVNQRAGTVVDLGCGNGWYLRKLAERFPDIQGIGVDGFEENIRQAKQQAKDAGFSGRMNFQSGDIYHFTVDEPVDIIVMNRAMHHVWQDKQRVFEILAKHLKPGGAAIIWEPAWPEDRSALRDPSRRAMAFQNLSEHVQGNHFLQPHEIQSQFRQVDMESEVFLFMEGNEALILGYKK